MTNLAQAAEGAMVDFLEISEKLTRADIDLRQDNQYLAYWRNDPRPRETYTPEAIQRNIDTLTEKQTKRLNALVTELYGGDDDLATGMIPQTMADLQAQAEQAQASFDPQIDEAGYGNAIARAKGQLGRLQNIHQFTTWWEQADRLMKLATAETLGPEIQRKFANQPGLGSLLADFERFSQAQRTSPEVAKIQAKMNKLANLEYKLFVQLERSPWAATQRPRLFDTETKLQKIRRRVSGYFAGFGDAGLHGGVMEARPNQILESS